MAAHKLRYASRHTGTALVGLLLLGAAGLAPAAAQSVAGGVAGGVSGPVPKLDGSKPDVRIARAPAPPRATPPGGLQPSPMPDISALPSAAPGADATASADPAPGDAPSGDAGSQAAIPRPAMSQPGPVASAPVPPADAAPDAPPPAADAQIAAAPMPKETEWLDTTPQVATAEPAPVPAPPAGPPSADALPPPPTVATRTTPSPMPDLPPPVVADIPRAPGATADAVMHIAHPELRDTATVVVDGKDVVLYGIDGYGGEDAAALQKYIAEVGGTLDCRTEQSDRHVCTLPDGSDIAEVALANGIARVALGGPESYKTQESAAQNARRGLWGELPPLAPQFDHPTVPDTGTLQSPSGDVYRLDGIEGVAGPFAATIQAYIVTHGDNAACQPQGPETFVCLLPDQTDIAKLALVNGLAKAAPDALPEYRIEQDAAQINHRGIWANIDAAAVNLAQRDMAQQQGLILSFDASQEGFSIIDGQPTLLVEGAPVFMVFAGAAGWGYWDRAHSWHGAPDRVAGRLEAMHPHGQGLRGWSNSGTRMAMATARPGEFGRGAPVAAGRPAGAGFAGAGRGGLPGGAGFAGRPGMPAPGMGAGGMGPGRPGMVPVGLGAGGRAGMPAGGMGMGGHPGMPGGGVGMGGHPGMPGGVGMGGHPGMPPAGMGMGGRPGMPAGGMGMGGRPGMPGGGMPGGGMMGGRPGMPMGGGRPAMGAPAMAPRPPVMAARAPVMAPHPAPAPAAPHRR